MFEIYLGTVTHFRGTGYNFIKYGTKIRSATESSLSKRKDKIFFEKLARQSPNEDYAIKLIFANSFFSKKGSIWPGGINKGPLLDISKFLSSFEYHFEDLYNKYFPNTFKDDIYDIIQDPDKEFFIYFWIMEQSTNGLFTRFCNKTFKDDILWTEFQKQYNLYKDFFSYCWPLTDLQKSNVNKKILAIEQEKNKSKQNLHK